jgi:putative ABC transport system permease protein
MRSDPPAFAQRLVAWTLTDADRDVVLGDLAEEFAARVDRDGPRRARQWYWRQCRGCVVSRARARWSDSRESTEPRRLASSVTGGLMRDFSYAIRALRATPSFTIVALVVLALGIGATTAIYSVVDGVALRGLPYPEDGQLMQLSEPNLNSGRGSQASAPEFHDWRAQQTTFDDLAASRGAGVFITRDSNGAESLRVTAISANLLAVLKSSPALGRGFTTDDEVPGRDRVAILSDQFWRRHFSANPGVVGQTIAFESGVWTIVGVMPASFMYPAALSKPMDLWVPYAPKPGEFVRGTSANFNLQVIGRRKRGVPVERAQADIERITASLKVQSPEWFHSRGVAVVTLLDTVVGPVKGWMLMLLGAVAFVLLIACVNVANLLLARATARARDAAVRSALGASRWRILRGLLAESLILSVTGTAIGVALAIWGVHVLRVSLPPNLPRLSEVAVNARVLIGAALVALAVTLGVTPVWQTSRTALGGSLRESGRSGGAGAARARARSILLSAEVALAVVLLIGAGLFMSSFVRLMRVDLGFNMSNILSADVSPRRRATKADIARLGTNVEAAMAAVRLVPGVQWAALVSGTPPLLLGDDRVTLTVPGRPAFDNPDDLADDKLVTAEYFRVLQVPTLRGRTFTEADSAPGAPPVVLLNEVASARYFAGADPVGASVVVSGTTGASTVAGVVGTVRLQGPEGALRPEVYTPIDWQQGLRGNPILSLVMRTTGDPGAAGPAVRAAIRASAPDLPATSIQTYDELFGVLVAQRKFNMIVLALFGILAVAIAGVGIYGVMSYLVEQQTQEIGVRLALGAEPSRVVGMVLARATRMMAIGMAIGLAAGWVLARFVGAFLFQADPHDPVVYAAAGGVLAIAGLVAALVPARRASRVDPVVALRAQ